jgi:hypothetical protein
MAVVGSCVASLGLFATWNLVVPSEGEFGASVQGWMFEGPALVTFGLLLLWIARSAGEGERDPAARGPGLLLRIGLAFLVLPATVWVWSALSGGQLASYAWSLTAFALGVPGVALAATGAALLLWRRVAGQGESSSRRG